MRPVYDLKAGSMRVAPSVSLTAEQRRTLERMARQRTLATRVVERAKIVLAAADGLDDQDVAKRLGITRRTAARWRARFLGGGIIALEKDAPRSGRARTIDDTRVNEVLFKTLEQRPDNVIGWSTRSLARAAGISEASVRRIRRANGMTSRRVSNSSPGSNSAFSGAGSVIVGVYLNSPEHAIALCSEDVRKISGVVQQQHASRARSSECGSGICRRPGGGGTWPTATDPAEKALMSISGERDRHGEWLKFLCTMDSMVPPEQWIHVIADNLETSRHPKIQRWLEGCHHIQVDFVPPVGFPSYVVGRLFRKLSKSSLPFGVVYNIEVLVTAMGEYADHFSSSQKPFVWTSRRFRTRGRM
jgi:transposase